MEFYWGRWTPPSPAHVHIWAMIRFAGDMGALIWEPGIHCFVAPSPLLLKLIA